MTTWEDRFRATAISLPQVARNQPLHAIYRSNATGVFEWYAFDRGTGESRQLTQRPHGTESAQIANDGDWVWWFDDTSGDEFGSWRRQPWTGGDSEPATPGVPPGYSGGLAISGGAAAIGVATDDGSAIYWLRDGASKLVYQHANDANVGDLNTNATLLAITHSEHGDSLHPHLRILDESGGTVVELADAPGMGLYPIAFAPTDDRLLVSHERHGRPELLILTPDGVVTELHIELDGDIGGSWYPDGAALLVTASAIGRTTLHRYDLISGELTSLDTPQGVVMDAEVAAGGEVLYKWSSAAEPPTLRQLPPGRLPVATGTPAPPSIPVWDVWVPAPHGDIHVLVSEVPNPRGTIFAIHGGPHAADEDGFDPWRAAYLDAGFQVINVNYRGSTGYGSPWRDALIGNPGLTELADISAVWDWAVLAGVADSQRCIASGYSWGGYLTLLALGRQPDRWLAGVAGVPVADYVMAYAEEMEPLRAMDRVLFGGEPAGNPEVWSAANPITYADAVSVPMLVLYGENDPRCPAGQVERYLAAVAAAGHPAEVYRFDAGHGSLVTEQRIAMLRAELEFLDRVAR